MGRIQSISITIMLYGVGGETWFSFADLDSLLLVFKQFRKFVIDTGSFGGRGSVAGIFWNCLGPSLVINTDCL